MLFLPWSLTISLKGVIYSLGVATLPSLVTIKQMESYNIEQTMRRKVSGHSPCDVKFKRDNLLFRCVHCDLFGNCQTKNYHMLGIKNSSFNNDHLLSRNNHGTMFSNYNPKQAWPFDHMTLISKRVYLHSNHWSSLVIFKLKNIRYWTDNIWRSEE